MTSPMTSLRGHVISWNTLSATFLWCYATWQDLELGATHHSGPYSTSLPFCYARAGIIWNLFFNISSYVDTGHTWAIAYFALCYSIGLLFSFIYVCIYKVACGVRGSCFPIGGGHVKPDPVLSNFLFWYVAVHASDMSATALAGGSKSAWENDSSMPVGITG